MAEELTPQTVDEPVIQFKTMTERDIYRIVNDETKEIMVEIAGYGIEFGFNMAHINSVQDVEAACEGISSLFRDLIMEKLIGNSKQSE